VLDEANLLSSSWVTSIFAAHAKELADDRAGAEQDLEAMWSTFRDTLGGAPHPRAQQAAYRLARLYCDDGRWDDAEERLAFYRDAPHPKSGRNLADRLVGEARLAAHRDDHRDAATFARRAVEIMEPTDDLNSRAGTWLALAEVQRAAGRTAEADAAVARALELYQQKGNLAAAATVQATAKAAAT
jgi:tetratricopeptide (TPR) repeat protein